MEAVTLDACVLDALLPDLVGHDRKLAALVVYLVLYRHAAKQNWAVRLSHQAIADATGLSRSAVQAALAHLQRRELVVTTRATPTAMPLHKVVRPWRRLAKSGGAN